ncbi:MAG TPA: methylated-DNA--[protein]-cysteine S-methyltransferase [Candidatus Krumholzibacteria bacterium]|nr:methylated-DNA--[protein]-cysteine S-methyltransferase [Candidatus Krumholzibacteria bacterium]
MKHAYATILDSPVGPLLLASDGTALTHLLFEREDAPAAADRAAFAAGRRDAVLDRACAQLQEYFAGRRRTFDLPLAPTGTAFQRAVWRALEDIPYGRTESYGTLADRVGRPRAVRAVGAANGRNPISIIVPCHRVIGADGSLTGYGGGLDAKRFLLALEAQA